MAATWDPSNDDINIIGLATSFIPLATSSPCATPSITRNLNQNMRRARRRSQLGDVDTDMSHSDSNPGPNDSMEVDSEYGGSASTKRVIHSNKRPRISNTESTECSFKAAGITDLSIELFIEVAKYLRPGDLLSLARCKPFRSYLMSKSSQFLWLEVMKNVRGLPSCPPGFTEPQYLTVLFSGFCTACGKTRKSQMDAILLVRLCDPCQKICLLQLTHPQVPVNIRALIHKSNVFGKVRMGVLPAARVLRSDVDNVVNALGAAERSGSDHVQTELEKQLVDAQSEKIVQALELSENESFWEKKETQMKRRLEIERKCIHDMKWQKEDLQFAWDSPGRKRYYQLLNKPELLSSCEWESIYPQLNRLLDANRKARLATKQVDRSQCQLSYQGELGCFRQPLILDIDPVMDGLSQTERIELLHQIG
ncbi:unnamed protein product [Rhizoctonia solani]|uniref:F-box domain-containing protein n=1 Tax=Rhizoctonia solani TaxID=456999 RepID=A0A8H3GNY5_9AGAM|nr:unnamed protein product [Rhizoctonia solani]